MNLSSKNIRFILAVIIVPIIISVIWFHESNKKLIIAHSLYDSSLQTNILRIFTDNVELATNNEIKFELSKTEEMLWPGSRLSELAETGKVDISNFLLSAFSPDLTPFSANSLPYIAQNFDQAKALSEVSQPYLEKTLSKNNLMLLFFIPWPPQGLFLKKPLTNDTDLKKIKIRVFDKIGHDFIQKIGFTPVLTENHEISKALDQGSIDGSLGSKTHFYDFGYTRTLPYFYDLKLMLPKYAVVMNKEVFQNLPDEKQQAILENANFTDSISWRLSAADEYKKTMIMKKDYQKPPQWLLEKTGEASVEIISEWMAANEENKALLRDYKRYLQENNITAPHILRKIPLR